MKVLAAAGRILLIGAAAFLTLAAVVLAFLFLAPPVGQLPSRNEEDMLRIRSNRYTEGRFHNLNAVRTMSGKTDPPSSRKTPKTVFAAQTPDLSDDPQDSSLRFTWIGHSSFLLQIGKSRVLVDPVLSQRCSPVSFAGPRRFSQLPLTAEELPEIDVLFLSHDHYDHLDYRTIRTIRDRVALFVVPLGVDAILRGWGVGEEKIRALDWWESAESGGVTFTLTPGQHFTGRNPLRTNRTLWGGIYMDNGVHRVYYTGDTGYCRAFEDVRQRLGDPELMIAECGQYDPGWAQVHMFPEQTAQAAIDTGTEWLIPVHWGSFSICNHAWDDSIRRIAAAAAAEDIRLAVPQIGQTVGMAELASCTDAWWEAYV